MRFPIRSALVGGAAALLLAQLPLGAARQDAGAAAVAEDVDAAVQAVIDRYRSAYSEWVSKYRAAAPEERAKIAPVEVDGFVTELVSLAESAPKTEAAAKAWMMVVQLAPQGKDSAVLGVAIDTILRDHMASDQVAMLPGTLARALEPDEALAKLRQIAQQAPKGALRGNAMLELARMLAEDEGTVAGSAGEKELEGLVADLIANYADLTDRAERSYADLAEGILFSRKHLQVGMTVPEIEAADTQGVSFKLSDYRGKVVLLDFWGNW